MERAELERRVWQGIGARGLGGPTGLHPELDYLLRLFNRPEREVDGRVWIGKSVRVLAVANGDDGAVATLTENRLTFRRAAIAEAFPSVAPEYVAREGGAAADEAADGADDADDADDADTDADDADTDADDTDEDGDDALDDEEDADAEGSEGRPTA